MRSLAGFRRGLGNPYGTVDPRGTARGVSADGSVIVGSGGAGSFVWDAAHGMRRFEDVLTAAGIDLTGWSGFDLYDVSADGLTFAGTGTHADGSYEAFVATVPEPASLGAFAIAAAAACARRRRHR